MKHLAALLTLAWIAAACHSAQAARLPDTIEKKFVIEGQAAIDVMSFLGFPSDHDVTRKLPWKRDTSICYDGNGLTKLCDPAVRVNTISYKLGKRPRVEITGYWLDGETGSLPDVPRYSFQSPPLNSTELGDWVMLVSKHGKALAPATKSVEINTEGVPLIRITSYVFEGHTTYYLGIDDRPAGIRRMAQEQETRCLKNLQQSGVDGGC